jgi:succinate dehydrogenase hydrophobic anchor subunit
MTKILSGFALTGRWGSDLAATWTPIHRSPFLDLPLLFLFSLHSMYGIKTVIVDLGARKQERLLFWLASSVGFVGACAVAYLAYR